MHSVSTSTRLADGIEVATDDANCIAKKEVTRVSSNCRVDDWTVGKAIGRSNVPTSPAFGSCDTVVATASHSETAIL